MEAFAAQNAQLFQTLADAKADEWIRINMRSARRLVTRVAPLRWGATHGMIRCKTMCQQSVRKTGLHIKKVTKQQQTKYKNNVVRRIAMYVMARRVATYVVQAVVVVVVSAAILIKVLLFVIFAVVVEVVVV